MDVILSLTMFILVFVFGYLAYLEECKDRRP